MKKHDFTGITRTDDGHAKYLDFNFHTPLVGRSFDIIIQRRPPVTEEETAYLKITVATRQALNCEHITTW